MLAEKTLKPAIDRANDASPRNRALLRTPTPTKEQEWTQCTPKSEAQSIESLCRLVDFFQEVAALVVEMFLLRQAFISVMVLPHLAPMIRVIRISLPRRNVYRLHRDKGVPAWSGGANQRCSGAGRCEITIYSLSASSLSSDWLRILPERHC